MKYLLALPTVLLFSINFHAQDPLFTQFQSIKSYTNPALMCSESNDNLSLVHRNQWPSLSSNYVTSGVEYGQYHSAVNGTGYVRYVRDHIFAYTHNEFVLGYAKQLVIGKYLRLNLGAELGFFQNTIAFAGLNYGNIISPRRGFVYNASPLGQGDKASVFGLDMTFGTVLSRKGSYLGFAVSHLNRPNVSVLGAESRLPIRYGVQLRHTQPVGTMLKFIPYVASEWQASFASHLIGMDIEGIYGFILTMGWRTGNGPVGGIGYDFERLIVRYSFDHYRSELTRSPASAHELSVSIKLWKKSAHPDFATWQ